MSGITVVIPVGPDPVYKEFLPECLDSIIGQMLEEDEILIVDDRANFSPEFFAPIPVPEGAYLNYVKNDWCLGAAASWNIGIELARNENCIMMGSDDKLLEGCLDACRLKINAADYDPLGYYNLVCLTSEGELVGAFNNAAMVSKHLWHYLGGFPPSAGVGGPDAMIISIMMVHMATHLLQVNPDKILYWVRVGSHQDTLKQGAFFSWEMVQIRDKETSRWKPATWE